MTNIWFTSDHHFGHKNILEYEKEARPFKSLEEMHEVMIERWNNVVKPKDIMYHLGDFAFGRNNISIANRLNGKKRLVMGNHDAYSASEYLAYFDKLYGVLFWERCILSHVPVHPNGLGSRWLLNLHGHLHSKNIKICTRVQDFPSHEAIRKITIYSHTEINDPNYFNVSVERNNLTPFHADIIRDRLKELT